jgi:hypothetical protein
MPWEREVFENLLLIRTSEYFNQHVRNVSIVRLTQMCFNGHVIGNVISKNYM